MEQREKGTATFSRLRTPTFPEGKEQSTDNSGSGTVEQIKKEVKKEVSNENSGSGSHPLENMNRARGSTKKKKKYV